jgi:hypothetical protein
VTERIDDRWSSGRDLDSSVRVAAFAFLAEQVEARGEVLPRDLLATGFVFEGQHIPLMGPQGIFKPAALDMPLSITTSSKAGPGPTRTRSIPTAS